MFNCIIVKCLVLANSVNINCHPFQVKINCSKIIIDGLQQLCHMALLVSLIVTSRNFFYCSAYFCQEKLLQSYEK